MTYGFLRHFDAIHQRIVQENKFTRIFDIIGETHVSIRREKKVQHHVFNCLSCVVFVSSMTHENKRLASFVMIHYLVQFEPHGAYLDELISVLDVIAYLIVKHSGRGNNTMCVNKGERGEEFWLPVKRDVGRLSNHVRITLKVINPRSKLSAQLNRDK